MVVFIAAIRLHLGHNSVKVFRRKAHVLVVQAYNQPADKTYDKRIRNKAKRAARHPRRRIRHNRAKHMRKLVPYKGQAPIHQEEKRPHESAGKRTCRENAHKEQRPIL